MNDKKKCLLEICVDSVKSALAAAEGGADRLELCANLVIGGTSPSPKLFEEIRKWSQIPIRVLLRPRWGDFCYTEYEKDILLSEIEMFRQMNAQGVVIGVLEPEGNLAVPLMEKALEIAGDMPVTLHRAFDMTRDPIKTMEDAITLGIDTILTSGQGANCMAGVGVLAQLKENSKGRIDIMAGAGVTASNIVELYRKTGITTYHMSGKKRLDSAMKYRKEEISMGLPGLSEYENFQTSIEAVKEARIVVDGLEKMSI